MSDDVYSDEECVVDLALIIARKRSGGHVTLLDQEDIERALIIARERSGSQGTVPDQEDVELAERFVRAIRSYYRWK